jgi:hypothetical protein
MELGSSMCISTIRWHAKVPAAQWLTPGHRRAKAVTNCAANRFGDVACPDPDAAALLDGVEDDAIAHAITAVADLLERWDRVPPGGTLRLSWPLGPATDDTTAR